MGAVNGNRAKDQAAKEEELARKEDNGCFCGLLPIYGKLAAILHQHLQHNTHTCQKQHHESTTQQACVPKQHKDRSMSGGGDETIPDQDKKKEQIAWQKELKEKDSDKSTDAPPGEKFKRFNVLLVRHGESEGNVATDSDLFSKDPETQGKLEDVFKGSESAYDEILSQLLEPSLTSLGFAQADRLAGYAGPLADSVGKDGKVCMFVSPHLRTCQTGYPLFQALNAKNFVTAEVKEDLFEKPGLPKTKMHPGLVDATSSLSLAEKVQKFTSNWDAVVDEESQGNGQSERHIKENFVGYNTTTMTNRGENGERGWCTLKKFETLEDSVARAKGTVEWLLSEKLYRHCAEKAPNGDPWVVLVAHGGTNHFLISELLGTPTEHFFAQFNTGVTHFSIQHKVKKPSEEGGMNRWDSHITLVSMNQVEHLWTIPHGFGDSPPLPLGYQTGKSGAWNNYGRA